MSRGGRHPGPLPLLPDLLDRHGGTLTDRWAYTFLGDGEQVAARFAYRDLPQAARAVAALLQEYRRPGERALLLYPPGPEFVLAFLGCLYAGVVAVPTHPPSGEKHLRRLRAIVEDAGAGLVLTTSALVPELDGAAGGVGTGLPQCVSTDGLDLTTASAWREVPVGPDTLAMLQYTSGSTGSPKGVMLTHGNIAHNCLALRDASYHDDPVFVSWLPQFHDMGLIANILQALYVGAHAVTMPPEAFLREPVRWLRAITSYGATWSGGPNFAYDLCVRRTDPATRESLDLSSWQAAFNGAEPIRATTLRAFTDAFAPYGFRWETWYPGYGLAESTVYVTASRIGAGARVRWLDPTALGTGQARPVPESAGGARAVVQCGWPSPDTEIRVVDPDTLVARPPGTVGEVWLRSPSVGAGYWGNARATRETFRARLAADDDPGEWLRTGDLGYLDEGGGLCVTGRLKDVLIVQGLNHYPQDLEVAAEEAHALLRPGCGAAFTVEAGGEERLVLVFEVRRDTLAEGELSQVVTAVSGALLEVHGLAPAAISLVRKGTIAKTTSGKIARGANRQAFVEGVLDVVAAWVSPTVTLPLASTAAADPVAAPGDAGSLERALLDAMAGQLGVPPGLIDPGVTFAENGMDSAGLVELAAVASRHASRYVRPAHFFEHPTPARAARALAATGPAEVREARAGAEEARAGEARAGADEAWAGAVAVVGIGCRFPGAADPEALWALLRDGRDRVGEPPAGRAALGLHAGAGAFLEDVAGFDATCFGIAPREARWVDPQQRLLLEVAWEALEDANLLPSRVAGRPVGVFVGISNSDYGRLAAAHPANAYAGTGTALSVAANRISYFFDFQGPSVAVDTACSASLVAVHQAVTSLRVGESELALAGGVNLVLTPYVTAVFDAANMLSPTGRCRAFDDRADGYVRGEGCGVVVLKRLSDALADGDRVRAVIRGSAVSADGRSNGLTAPNGRAQRRVVVAALRDAGVAAHDVGYVETHGTGTPLGDPIEFEALSDVFSGGPGAPPTYLGSIKTNLGHTESAAGIAGLLKVVLAVERGWLPPHLHFEQPNRHLDLAPSGLEILTEGRPWPPGAPRIAGVSSFGFGGTNAHVVVAAPTPAREAPRAPGGPAAVAGSSCELLALSAHSREALVALAERYAAHLDAGTDDLAAVCWSARRGRAEREHRLAVAGATREEVGARLSAFARDGAGADVAVGQVGRDGGGIAFVFGGQGSEVRGTAAALAAWSPLFRRELEACLQALDPALGAEVHALLHGTGEGSAGSGRTGVAQPALFAFEYALARVWQSWGVVPTCVAGHSLGEYVAAALAGVFSPTDGMRLVAARGALLDEVAIPGAMAVLAAGAPEVEQKVLADAPGVSVAAFNGPRQVVIAGDADAVRRCAREAAAMGLACKLLSERYAFHCHHVDPAVEHYRAQVALVALHPPRIDLVSSVTGRLASDELATPDYWADQLREPVRFEGIARTLADRGCAGAVEVSPAPVLVDLVRRGADRAAGGLSHCVASARPGRAPERTLLEGFGRLWTAGLVAGELAAVDFGGPAPAGGPVTLPTYPFQRRHHWLPDPPSEPAGGEGVEPTGVEIAARPRHPLLGRWQAARNGNGLGRTGAHEWTRLLRPRDVALVDDHRIEGRPVLPGVTHLEFAMAAAREAWGTGPWELADVEYASMLVVPDAGRQVRVSLTARGGSGDFRVESREAGEAAAGWVLHARGRVLGGSSRG